jgi:hypothetical protein
MSGLQSQEIFQTVREEYLAHLRQAIDTAKLSRPDLVAELALRVNGEHEHERLLLVRIDMVWNEDGETQLANAELDSLSEACGLENGDFLFDGIMVQWRRFRWHACLVELVPLDDSLTPIWEWFDRWFDVDETKALGADGLSGVIHGISGFEMADRTCRLMIDFGSAPVSVVAELLRACGRAGANAVSFS